MRIQLILAKSLEQCLVGSKCCVNSGLVDLGGPEQGSDRKYGSRGAEVEAGDH